MSVPVQAPLRRRRPSFATALLLALAALVLAGSSLAAAADPIPTPTPIVDPTTTPTPTPDPTPTPTADPTPTPTPTPPPTTITFYGRGYGHGVGMSQYGALGRAQAGQDAATILAHYYEGTALGATGPARPVRVLVLAGSRPTATAPLRLYGRGGTWTIDGIARAFPPNALLRVTRVGTRLRLRVTRPTGAVLLDRTVGPLVRVRAGSASTARIQVWSKPSYYDTYRGVIRLQVSAGAIQVVNETTLDAYLRGVVPAEMPAGWPVEALKSQVIAARSYAVRRLHPTTGSFDLYDDTRSQVYRGSLGEKAATNAAIAATAGVVLKSGTSVANALFHSTDGGATEDNENVFVSATGAIVAGPVAYLRGSSDRAPNGSSYDAAAPHATWQTATYTLDQLSALFGLDPRTAVGALSVIDLSARGVSGRLIRVTLHGSAGAKTVSGDVFRAVFNAGTPAADPYMWSTLVNTSPIP